MNERTSLRIARPDDWHLHLRDGEMLKAVLPYTARHFARAIVMPNLSPPVTTTAMAYAYRERILAALPSAMTFTPLMTLYLTDTTDAGDVRAGAKAGLISAVKLYPAGATTNSAHGVRDIERVHGVLETMAEIGLPLLVHGEVVADDVDIFDREAVFIDTVLFPLRERFPSLKIVLEHVTTYQGVDFVMAADGGTAGTITPHHLILNRNAMLVGGMRPHYFCLPVAKREAHRLALRKAATSGDERFFLGTDSAPHGDGAKQSACGCAGIFNAPVALACLAHVFEEDGALDALERFASLNGPKFYALEPNRDTVMLEKSAAPGPFEAQIDVGTDKVTVFDPGFRLCWRVRS